MNNNPSGLIIVSTDFDFPEATIHFCSNLPHSINAFTTIDTNSRPIIFVNANLTHVMQKEAIHHELLHIHSNDFYNNKNIEDVEHLPYRKEETA